VFVTSVNVHESGEAVKVTGRATQSSDSGSSKPVEPTEKKGHKRHNSLTNFLPSMLTKQRTGSAALKAPQDMVCQALCQESL
jgi:hypothetical protein